jgi:hypothetical protein
MRGHERIIAARMKGLKPAGWVMVDVGLRSDQAMLLKMNGIDASPGVPLTPYVCLGPAESARTADWGWLIGLKVQVDGDDLPRVEAAHERICAAGAARVVSSCVLSRDDVRVFDYTRAPR